MNMIINLTPHLITEVTTSQTFPASGVVARVATIVTAHSDMDGIPINTTTFGEVIDLPEPADDTYYLVSGLVLDASQRQDLLASGELVRDAAGNPTGCRGFRAAEKEIEYGFATCQVVGKLVGTPTALKRVKLY